MLLFGEQKLRILNSRHSNKTINVVLNLQRTAARENTTCQICENCNLSRTLCGSRTHYVVKRCNIPFVNKEPMRLQKRRMIPSNQNLQWNGCHNPLCKCVCSVILCMNMKFFNVMQFFFFSESSLSLSEIILTWNM